MLLLCIYLDLVGCRELCLLLGFYVNYLLDVQGLTCFGWCCLSLLSLIIFGCACF